MKPRKFTDVQLSMVMSQHEEDCYPSRCCTMAVVAGRWCHRDWPVEFKKACGAAPYSYEEFLRLLEEEGLA